MIRELYKNDIDKIMDIWLDTNIKAHDFIDKSYWKKNYDIVKDVYVPNSKTLVYEDDEVIKGFISIVEDSYIGALFVSNEYQGKGIGRQLIDFCKSKYNLLSLAVYADNKMAVEFYEKCNFKIVKQQCNEDSNHTEYIMEWVQE